VPVTRTHTLSDFQRNAREYLRRLRKSGQPAVLTVRGKAELVVQDAESYQKLLDALDQAESVAGIRRGLEQAERGEGRPARQVLERIANAKGIDLAR
jgi:prevent-host-death family protein